VVNERNACRIFVGKTKENRPLDRPICWLEYNIEMDFRGIEWSVTDWIDLAKDRDQ
jgi:hypothetical protein